MISLHWRLRTLPATTPPTSEGPSSWQCCWALARHLEDTTLVQRQRDVPGARLFFPESDAEERASCSSVFAVRLLRD